jgi:hypothetical protein
MKSILILLFGIGVLSQTGCAPLAAGAAGAVIGNEVAEERDEDDGDAD